MSHLQQETGSPGTELRLFPTSRQQVTQSNAANWPKQRTQQAIARVQQRSARVITGFAASTDILKAAVRNTRKLLGLTESG